MNFPEPTILIADDEPILLESLAELIKEIECKVITVQNGKQLVDIATTTPVHAILSDINMPQMSGLDALSNLRMRGSDIPFVFLTGYGDSKNISAALRLGAFDFHEKPFDDSMLLETMKSALEYGIALAELNSRIDNLLNNVQVPEDIRKQLENAHRKVGSMRILNRMQRRK